MSPVVIVIGLMVILGAIWLIYQLVWGTPWSINLAVERLALKMVMHDPETLTSLGMLDNTLLDFHSDKLTDASPRYMAALRQLDRDGLSLIRRYDPETLSGQHWMTYQLMRWYYKQNLRGHRFDYHWGAGSVFMGPYPVNHVFGVQINLINFLSTYHKINGWSSVRRYLKRLDWVDWKLAGLQESLRERESVGIIPPRFVIEKSLRQVEKFINSPVEENPLYTSFIERLEGRKRICGYAKHSWGNKVKNKIQTAVIPAYEGLLTYLVSLLNQAPAEDGVWQLPDGQAYYAFLLRAHTTTDMTAEEIHQLGLDEVERLSEEIRAILMMQGMPADHPGQQLKILMESPDYHYQGEERRKKIVEDYQAILDEANDRMPELFSQGALAEIRVRRLPEFREPDSPIAYAEAPAMDGSRPGIMWLNLRDPENIYQWGMRTLAYHEGIPGHVYQLAHAQKIRGLPTFRRAYFFNAYVEGWAMYAERLGWELALEDSLSNLGRLQALIWRAARLVVDTGIHTKRWTREEAIAYLIEKTGLPERDVVTEVERYIVAPGQACAYYIGYLKILALRQKAKTTLGGSFNLRDFHDVILNHGGLPLELLEKVVNDYVDRKMGLTPKPS